MMKPAASSMSLSRVISVLFKYWGFIAVVVVLATGLTAVKMVMSPDIYEGVISVAVNPEASKSVSLLRKESAVTTTPLRELVNSEMAQLLSSQVVADALYNLKPEKYQSPTDPALIQEVSIIRKSLVSSPVRNTTVTQIRYLDEDPVFVANLLNELVDERLEDLLHEKDNPLSGHTGQIVEDFKHSIDSLDREISDLQLDQEVYQSGAQLTALISEQSSNEMMINDLRVRIVRERATLKNQIEALGKDVDILGFPRVETNSLLSNLKRDLLNAQTEDAGLAVKFTPENPQRALVRQRISQIESQFRQEAGNEVRAAETRIASLEQEQETLETIKREYRARLGRFPEFTARLAQLQSIRDEYVSNLGLMQDQQKELTMSNLQLRSSRYLEVISPASVPEQPVRPRRFLNTIVACLLSLTLSIGLAFFFETLSNTFETPDELSSALDLMTVATLRRIDRS